MIFINNRQGHFPVLSKWRSPVLQVLILLCLFASSSWAQIISTAAGGPPCVFGNPVGVAVDRAGNIYFSGGSSVCRRSSEGVITLVAGNGAYGYSGDGEAAKTATLNFPTGIAVDAEGNLYIADYMNHRVRKVTIDGTISTVAGNGVAGYAGDGGMATAAQLNRPAGIVVDGASNLYIADSDNNRIRKVARDGVITTIAGNGKSGYFGDGAAATAAQLFSPSSVAVDGLGNLYIADTVNDRVRRVARDGIINTIAGNGAPGFSGDSGAATAAQLFSPRGVAVDSEGDIYIADSNNSRIRKVTLDGLITTIAGNGDGPGYFGDGGPATAAQLGAPVGIALDGAASLYIADGFAIRIRKIGTSGTISTVVGSGTFGAGSIGDGGVASAAQLFFPNSVATDRMGNLYIADSNNHRVRKIASDGTISTVAGQGIGGYGGDGGAATAAQLAFPKSIAFDSAGNVYIADWGNNRIRKIASDGTISTVAGNGTSGYSGDGGLATAAQLNYPSGVAVDGVGNLYIADSHNNRIRKVDGNGILSTVAGNGISGFSGDGGVAALAQLSNPSGIVTDSAGDLYIADSGNNRVRKVAIDKTIATVAGDGAKGYSGDGGIANEAQLTLPTGVAVDTAGNLYIADSGNYRIRKVAVNSMISTVAGNGSPGYSGNNGPAVDGQLNNPTGVAVDAAGKIYIADSFNHAIREVSAGGLYVALNPARLLDTRVGAEYRTIDGIAQAIGPIASLSIYRLPVAGRARIPSSVVAVALNVTPVNPTRPGYFTLWSGIGVAPNASNLNLNPGLTIPNLVISPVDASGNVAIFNGSSGAQDVVVDVQGYFPLGSAYVPMTPQRYLETRKGHATVDGQNQGVGALIRGGLLDLNIAGRTSIPAIGVDAAIFNLTVVQPIGAGYVTVWPNGDMQPNASNLNFNAGLTIPNLVISGLGSGAVSLFNGGTAAADLLVDVQGWFPSGSGYMALVPARLLDTRNGQNTIDGQYAGKGALAAGTSLDLQVSGRGGVLGAGTVVLSVASVLPTQGGYITVWPTGSVLPLASSLNLNPGTTIANLALVKVGSNGKVSIFNGSQAAVDVLVDVQGWMPGEP